MGLWDGSDVALEKREQAKKACPPYLSYITGKLDEVIARGEAITEKQLFGFIVHPGPLQLFFAGYLRGDLTLKAGLYKDEARTTSDKRVATARNIVKTAGKQKYFYDPALLRNGKRPDTVFPMPKVLFEKAARAMMDELVQDTAAVLQGGINEYYAELSAVLISDFGIDKNSRALSRLANGQNFQSIWREFQFFLAATADRDFSEAHTMASAYQAFESVRRHIGHTPCPAKHMVKHLLNTDFIEQPDGSLDIAVDPRDGALPAFIYRKLKEQAALSSSPAKPCAGRKTPDFN